MEKDNKKNDQQQYTIQRNTATYFGSSPTHAMALSMYPRPFDSSISSMRNDYRRLSNDQSYNNYDSGHRYQEQTSPQYHYTHNTTLQIVQPDFSEFNDNGRNLQYSMPQEHNSYTSYTSGLVLPPMQQPPSYGTAPLYPIRQTALVESSYGNYTAPPYLPSTDHDASPTEVSSNLYPSSNSMHSGYDSVPVSHGGNIDEVSHTDHNESHTAYHISTLQNQSQMTNPYLQPSISSFGALHSPQLQHQDDIRAQFVQYEDWIRAAFTAINNGHLHSARDTLLLASNWLIASIVLLELNHDDVSEYDRRLHMWRDFNHCWEALAHKLKTHLERKRDNGHQDPEILDIQATKDIVNQLIGLCDQAEKYGLVDFEMGIWEDQIVDAFMICLDLLEASQQ